MLRLWEAPGGRSVAALDGHSGPAYGVALSANGGRLASCGEGGTVRVWERASGRRLATLHGHTGGVWSVSVSTDGRLLTSGCQDGAVDCGRRVMGGCWLLWWGTPARSAGWH
jgi:WD40 repeat protein